MTEALLLWTLASTLAVSLVSFAGVLTLSLKPKRLSGALLLLVALSAGALVGGAFFHLLPESLEFCTTGEGGALETMFAYVISGFVIFFVTEKFLHWRHCHDAVCKVHTFGYMNILGDAVHNFMDGLVIAAAYASNASLGMSTTLAIVFHEIPQEIGDFGVLLHSGMAARKAVAMNFLTALLAIAGGFAGVFLSSFSSMLAQLVLPVAAGGFIYIAASDLMPEIRAIDDTRKSVATFAVFMLGIALMWATRGLA